MPISDIYTIDSGLVAQASTTQTAILELRTLATKRAFIVGVRMKIGVTAAAAGNDVIFTLARSGNSPTGGGQRLCVRGSHLHGVRRGVDDRADAGQHPRGVGAAADHRVDVGGVPAARLRVGRGGQRNRIGRRVRHHVSRDLHPGGVPVRHL